MPREFSRTRRVGEQMRRDLSALIRTELRDPRLLMVSITAVDVSRDLSHAKAYVTILGDPAERGEIVDALNNASTLLRRELGRRMHIRTVPRVRFLYDEVVERGARLSSLISEAVASDKARHRDLEADESDPGGPS
jgi:ribosome-binding factor A